MTQVLVTGATGFLGEHVCRVLVGRGFTVRGLARTRSPLLTDLGVELVRGDVTRAADIEQALQGVAAVFHLAGAVSRDPQDAQRMMRLHVDGTRRVIEGMAAQRVRSLVLASTSGTIAISKDAAILDESAPYATQIAAGWPYYASKIYQEKLAFDLARELGVSCVAINPSLLLGPGDRRLSSTGDVRKFLRRELPVVPTGGVSFVDVRDVAEATVNALLQGRDGQRYLMGGPNWTFKEFFARLGRVANVAPPRLRLPNLVTRWGAAIIEDWNRERGRDITVDRISVEMAEHFWWLDSGKATAELGFEARDPMLTLHDTVADLRRGVGVEL